MHLAPLATVCLALSLAAACSDDPAATADTDSMADTDAAGDAGGDTSSNVDGPPNLLLVVLDDVGVEALEPWRSLIGATGAYAPTATIGALADAGVVFATAWATPTCSPTRLGLHAGLFPSHGGVLAPIKQGSPFTPSSETLPRLLGDTYRTGLFGKWHLGGGTSAPVKLGGWDHYSGQPDGALDRYDSWERVVVSTDADAVITPDTRYATSAVVDDALEWLGTDASQDPWLVMLAFNAPHTPFHVPPAELRPDYADSALDADSDGACDDDALCFQAMLQALDTELGRFIAALSGVDGRRDTIIVLLGDNGTAGQVVQPPFSRSHAKGTLFEGGLRVPLMVSGPADRVARGTSHGLAHATVDVFATLLELGGVSVPDGTDGTSLVPLLTDPTATVRDTLYCDAEVGPNDAAIEGAATRDATHKVLWPDVTVPNTYACYALADDADEQSDLVSGGSPPAICATLYQRLLELR